MKSYLDIEALLHRTIGLDVQSVGSSCVERSVRDRMHQCHLKHLDEYLELLGTSKTELQELVEAVVVPETYFFRHSEAFDALKKFVLEDWIPRSSGQVLRLLSIPCATGEEAYSIAMALLDCGLTQNQFQIDAVDISSRSLEIAQNGLYGNNSFRGVEISFRDRFFTRVKNQFRINDEARRNIRFHQANILDEAFLASRAGYDVIFCRNVLIYFDVPTQARAIEQLHRALREDGLFFVGPAEQSLVTNHQFTSAKFPLAFAFQKSKPNEKKNETANHVRAKKPLTPFVLVAPKPLPRPPAPASKPLPEKRAADKIEIIDLKKASQLADEGHLMEAAELCEQFLKKNGNSAHAFYILGLVRDAGGDKNGAGEFYRKTLYLEPNHYEALMHFSFLKEKMGDKSGAENLKNRAGKLKEREKAHRR